MPERNIILAALYSGICIVATVIICKMKINTSRYSTMVTERHGKIARVKIPGVLIRSSQKIFLVFF